MAALDRCAMAAVDRLISPFASLVLISATQYLHSLNTLKGDDDATATGRKPDRQRKGDFVRETGTTYIVT